MTGLCCRCFTLPLSPDQIWENYIHWIVEGWGYTARIAGDGLTVPLVGVPLDANGHAEVNGIAWIVEHVRYIGYRPWSFGRYEHPAAGKELLHFYTCDLFNPRTGMCSDHDNRHQMCRTYMQCEHPESCDSLWCSCHPIGKFIGEYLDHVSPSTRLGARNRR